MARTSPRSLSWLWVLAFSNICNALTLDITSSSSIKNTASSVAYGLMKYYSGNITGQTPGNLPNPYYWWEAGAMFMHLVDYSFLTGDTTYDAETVQAMSWQAGQSSTSFLPANQTTSEGNDDQ
ncbi:hypothetical protein B0A55_06571 [Friedmanniomyces simplex]|uniref:Mannan endo-1,6-alpha-mannosidase n=1 Tax=Friedmanniomyces simplex TaxID=329884 RepID=A0A4U0WYM5_9PEZI|nr:hypothetical protein B0A55_06571 [Friedmanniomyces simplex]